MGMDLILGDRDFLQLGRFDEVRFVVLETDETADRRAIVHFEGVGEVGFVNS